MAPLSPAPGYPSVAVVLPAFNEAPNLPPLIGRIRDALSPLPVEWQIVVVDDGSSDDTAKVAESLGRTLPVEVVRHMRNLGLDRAVTTGLLEGAERADVVITMDADNTHDPALVPDMLTELARGHDIVIASRFQPGAAEIGVPSHRRFLSHSVSHIMQVVGNVPGARDYSCGFRAYRANFLRLMLQAYGSELVTKSGFACMVELLLKASILDARVTEVPMVLRYDRKEGASKMRIARTVRRYGSVLWDHRKRRRRSRSYAQAATTREWPHRSLSAVLAGLIGVVSLPVFALVGGLVWLTSGGPVLVRHPRVGVDRRQLPQPVLGSDRRTVNLGGVPFRIIRFRTSVRGTVGTTPEGEDLPLEHGSLTRLGRMLRRTRLDEMPQLLNVLKGEMNLVGPRPLAPPVARKLKASFDEYAHRNRVRPGLTGAAQVNPIEGDVDAVLADAFQRDSEYALDRSVLTDLQILARTVPVVVTTRGAS